MLHNCNYFIATVWQYLLKCNKVTKFTKMQQMCILWQQFCSLVCTPEKAMAPHSNTLAWKIPWMEEPGALQSMGSRRVRHNWATSLSLSCIGEGNGNPLQCSCLENPRDRGSWWATAYGVAQSRTRLKWLSSSRSSKEVSRPRHGGAQRRE